MSHHISVLTLLIVALTILVRGDTGGCHASEIWTDSTGEFSKSATFVRVNDSSVVLRAANKIMSVPLAKLSVESRERAMSYHQRTLEVQSLINRGDPEEPANAPERFDRWRIMMNPSDDARTIAEALDHFKFELGLIGGGRKGVDYLSDLRLPRPTKSVMNDPAKEKRIYLMMVGESPLKRFAKSCFSRASVSTQDRMTLLLVPTNVEILLANLEREYCEEHGITSVADVKRTMFRVGKRIHPRDLWIEEVDAK